MGHSEVHSYSLVQGLSIVPAAFLLGDNEGAFFEASMHTFKAVIVCSLAAFLAGCSTGSNKVSGGGGGGGVQGKIYVADESSNEILRFDKASTATGNVSPGANISGAATQLNHPQNIVLDVSSNRLFVANSGGADILVFDTISNSNGNVAPNRVISAGSMVAPAALQLDTIHDQLYVGDTNQILVFGAASTATGMTAPLRTIQPGFTPSAILLDTANDRLFVANASSSAIDVFDGASTLNSAVVPNRTLTGATTLLSQPDGLQLDSAGRLVVTNFATASVTIYANAAAVNGNLAPASTITGNLTTLASPGQITINPAANGGELYVANSAGANVPVFSNINTVTGNQNVAPARNITGANTLLSGNPGARGIAVDTTR